MIDHSCFDSLNFLDCGQARRPQPTLSAADRLHAQRCLRYATQRHRLFRLPLRSGMFFYERDREDCVVIDCLFLFVVVVLQRRRPGEVRPGAQVRHRLTYRSASHAPARLVQQDAGQSHSQEY